MEKVWAGLVFLVMSLFLAFSLGAVASGYSHLRPTW